MATSRNYGAGDRAALISLSGGSCYWPGCGEPIVRLVNQHYEIALEIAHICALKPTGPRYDASMSDKERNEFANIIFLCHPHHNTVDKRESEKYPVETLQRWKSERETSGQAALKGLRDLTEDRLQALISEAFTERDKQISETLARLEQSDTDAASVLRGLVDELAEVRRHGSLLDPDVASMLYQAGNRLGPLQDYASLLYKAGDKLGGLYDSAALLSEAADKLGSLGDLASVLSSAANKLTGSLDSASLLKNAADKLEGLPAIVEALHSAVRDLRRYGREI